MTSVRSAVRPAVRADVPELAGMLARAFAGDPVQRWLWGSEEVQRRRSPVTFAATLRLRVRHDTAWTTPALTAAAMWDDPDHLRPGIFETLGLAVRTVPYLGRALPRMWRFMRLLERHHPRYPHWYLFVLGTEPSHQGAGLGSALLRPVLERCDVARLPAYLESSKASNVPYYGRHGFEVIDEIRLPEGPPMWLMLREPRTP